jgi:hypothetical protein
MTHLRKMMLEELQRRNYSENTRCCYIRTVEDFARRFNRSPDRLGIRHIREYQGELFQKGKLSANSVGLCAPSGELAASSPHGDNKEKAHVLSPNFLFGMSVELRKREQWPVTAVHIEKSFA